MAGYRPKSLDELNEMYGKTIEAEKAIKKGKSYIHTDESKDNAANFTAVPSEQINQQQEDDISAPSDISFDVDEFIKKFTSQETRPKKTIAPSYVAKPTAEKPKEETTAPLVKHQAALPRDYKTADTVIYKGKKQPIGAVADSDKIEERSELMDDYLKIMNDDEEEKSASHQKWKFKRKAAKKGNSDRFSKEAVNSEELKFDENLSEFDELYGKQDSSKKADSEFEVEVVQTTEFQPQEEQVNENNLEKPQPETSEPTEKNPPVEASGEEIEEYTNVFNDDYMDITKEKLTGHKSHGFAKAILSVILVLDLILVIAVGLFNTILNVNRGTTFYENYYLFTSTADYPDAGVNEGDLVLTQEKQPENGDSLAYINYTQKLFMFAQRTSAIVNENGQIVYIVENQGERTSVNRDDARGVVAMTIPVVGYFVTLSLNYFIYAIGLLILIAVIIMLIFCFGFKDETKAQEKKAKKEQKKHIKDSKKGKNQEENPDENSDGQSDENSQDEKPEASTDDGIDEIKSQETSFYDSDETRQEENLFDGID